MSTKYNPEGIPLTILEFEREHDYVGYEDYTLSGEMIVTIQTNDGQHKGSSVTVTPTLVITASSSTVKKDNEITLVAKYNGEDVTSETTFTSADTSIATVSGATVTGVAAGTVKINASYTHDETEETSFITIVVKEETIELVISGDSTVAVGNTISLTAKYGTVDVTDSANWVSSSAAKATVSLGQVTGVAAGSVTISATTADGTATASKEITVTGSTTTYTGYFGYLEDSTESESSAELTVTADEIKALNTLTISKVAYTASDTGTAPETENQLYLVYSFPASLGSITSVQTWDLNQWNDLSFNTKTVTIDEVEYTVIISNDTFETSNAKVKYE